MIDQLSVVLCIRWSVIDLLSLKVIYIQVYFSD